MDERKSGTNFLLGDLNGWLGRLESLRGERKKRDCQRSREFSLDESEGGKKRKRGECQIEKETREKVLP